ncbi:MAG: DUF4399 domain-containing protein [Actinomycetota bacterium]|nr:DUF4399 domain-containing protein [Actinomycetota bacterium]
MIVADGVLDAIPPGPGLVAAAALLVATAVYLFVSKRGAPILRIVLLILALIVLSGYLSAGSPKPPPRVTLTILSPANGAVVPAGHPIPLMLAITGAKLIPSSTQTFLTPPPANAGHIHILVDGRLNSLQMTGTAQVVLPAGRHTIAAEFVDPYHRSFSPRIIDRVHVIAKKGLVKGR